jgi:hypothetical protein
LLTEPRFSLFDRKYSPPEGFKAFKDAGAKSDIDWDTLHADSELQLWAVRVPAGVSSSPLLTFSPRTPSLTSCTQFHQLKSKHLDKMVIQLPPSSIQTPLQPVATFTASKSEYNAYLSTPSPSSTGGKGKHSEEDGEATEVNELDNMLPLLPKKSAGNKLFQGQSPFRP